MWLIRSSAELPESAIALRNEPFARAAIRTLLLCNDHLIDAVGIAVQFAFSETRIPEHLIEFAEGVGVPCLCIRQHDQGKTCGMWRSHAILIWDKFQGGYNSSGLECAMNFAQEFLVGSDIKVVKERGH